MGSVIDSMYRMRGVVRQSYVRFYRPVEGVKSASLKSTDTRDTCSGGLKQNSNFVDSCH